MTTTDITEDQLWKAAYNIAWIGGSNPKGIQYSQDQFVAQFGADHPAVRAIQGHLDFLNHKSIGPEFDDLEAVLVNGKRLGIHV